MPKRVVVGVVRSDKMKKTRRVEVSRLVKYPKYGKYVKRRTVCYVHDENNESALGDTVEIIESRPMSKLKRWTLVKVVSKSTFIDVAALRTLAKENAAES
jgi:small subunit ribosomal protein S17